MCFHQRRWSTNIWYWICLFWTSQSEWPPSFIISALLFGCFIWYTYVLPSFSSFLCLRSPSLFKLPSLLVYMILVLNSGFKGKAHCHHSWVRQAQGFLRHFVLFKWWFKVSNCSTWPLKKYSNTWKCWKELQSDQAFTDAFKLWLLHLIYHMHSKSTTNKNI